MYSRMEKFHGRKAQRFSIRKYSFGAASVLLGTALFLGANGVQAAAPKLYLRIEKRWALLPWYFSILEYMVSPFYLNLKAVSYTHLSNISIFTC